MAGPGLHRRADAHGVRLELGDALRADLLEAGDRRWPCARSRSAARRGSSLLIERDDELAGPL